MLEDERTEREDQTECSELGIRKEGEEERVVRAERESDKSRTVEKEQEER